jgi:hypothetical protein
VRLENISAMSTLGVYFFLAGSARTHPGSVNADSGFFGGWGRTSPTAFAVAEASLPREFQAF